MATTKDNLKEAFAGESQANQKYRAFAKKAEKDGFYQNSVRWMSPLMILSLPPGIIFDTLFLPATLSNLD